jgi:hypothetical protein
MSYASGGLIEAIDYNNLVGTNTSITSTTLNSVWAWGANSRGYGQTSISQVSAASTVTATQWATLVNTLNSANTHINGSSSGLTANTAGQVITYLNSLQTKINGVNSDRMLFASNSTTVVGTGLTGSAWVLTATNGVDNPLVFPAFGARVTFASADQARFFFNCGGRLKYNISSASSGTSRTAAIVTGITNMSGIALFAANTNGGRTGTGGTQSVNNTSLGYYGLTTANVQLQSVRTTNAAAYATDLVSILAKTNGPQGSFGDNGTQIDMWTLISSTSGSNAGTLYFDDSLNVSATISIDVSYPETTNLANTWGAVTITRL